MKIPEKEIEIGLAQGCQHRVETHKEIKELDKKIQEHIKAIKKLEEKKQEKISFDEKLAEEGFCLIDKEKRIHNPLTWQLLKIKKVHQDNCISKGE